MFGWRHALQEVRGLGDIELEPRYSSREIPGRCVRCLAEHEYADCLRQLLRSQTDGGELPRRYEDLVSFLKSPELHELLQESERYLAEGYDVRVMLHLGEGKPRYEIRLGESSQTDETAQVVSTTDDELASPSTARGRGPIRRPLQDKTEEQEALP
jgi:hypothetical protein